MSHLEQQFRVAELEVNKSTMDEKIVGVFRYESESKGKRGPIILILAEIASTLYVYEQLLDALNEKAEQVRHLGAGVDADPMARFEKLVQGLNDGLAEFLSHEPTPIAWNRVNIYALQLWDGHLCLTGIGRLMNLFLQKQKDGSHKTFDLFGSLEQPAEVNPQKPFASLICGDMAPGDMLFVGTTNFERLRTELGIAEFLTNYPPVTAALEIRQEVERRDIPDDFAGVVIANVELQHKIAAIAPVEKEEKIELPKSTQSIEKMHREEQQTQAMLSPAIAPLQKKGVNDEAVSIKDRLQKIVKPIADGLRVRLAKKTLLNQDPVALASLRGMSAGHGSSMTPKKRLSMIGATVLLVLGVTGTIWYHYAKKASAEQALWNSVYDNAADKKNKAEGSLVYGNEDGAQRLVQEAGTVLAGLDEKTADRKRAKESLLTELQDLRNRLKREIRADQPAEIFALSADTPENSLTTLALTSKGLISVDGSVGSVLQINPDTKQVKRSELTSAKSIIASTPNTKKDNVFLLTDDRALLVLSSGSSSLVTVPFSSKASSTQSIETYNARLYVLDTVGNMIWKYAASGSGFGSGSTYLQQTSRSLANATDIAIDSNVYVSFSDGKLARFLSGAEEAWSVAAIDPPLTSAASLWTHADADRIVVADPAGKRVVVFRKDGKLVGQIVSAAFKGPRFVTADEKARKIYVVDGNRILTVDLP